MIVEPSQTSPGANDERGSVRLDRLVDEHIARRPDHRAVVEPGRSVTYRELDLAARNLEEQLRSHGVVEGAVVALILGRSIDLVVAELACLRLGAPYVPIDPREPLVRIRSIDRATSPTVEVTRSPHGDLLVTSSLPVDAPATFDDAIAPDLLPAYVIFTSGSTGTPKGVVVPHRAIVRLVHRQDLVQLGSSDVVAFASNPSFDAATWEVWGALANGATLVVLDDDTVTSAPRLARALRHEQITALFLTTSLFNFIAYEDPSAFSGLVWLLFGGEACDFGAVQRVFDHGGVEHLVNGYGPTESTTFALWWEVSADDVHEVAASHRSIPIGLPLNGTTAAVVGADDGVVATGERGELLLGGSGLALGYLGDDALTQERFVSRDGERWYRTGDVVSRRPDGAFDYLGRVDRQLKIRGFRVQPEEIEAALASHPAVRRAAVLVHRGLVSNELHGVVEATGVSPNEVRAFLRQQLPEAMVPSEVTVLEHVPINQNGKIDRAALDELVQQRAPSSLSEHPTQFDDPITEIWSRILRVPNPDPDAQFVDLGGHSLLAARIVSEIRAATGIDLPLSVLVEHPSLRSLREAIEEQSIGGTRSKTLVTLRKGSSRSLGLVHPAGGLLYCFDAVVPRLKTSRSIRGFIAHGIETGGPWDPSFEAMAARYLSEMKQLGECDAPLVLGGFSSGGWVAVEMARLAQAEGMAVGGLILLDPPVLAALDPRSKGSRSLDRLRAGISARGFCYQLGTMRKRARAVRIEKSGSAGAMSLDVSSALNIDHTIDVLSRYRPAALEQAIATLVVNARRSKGPESRALVDRSCAEILGPGVSVVEVRAEHNGPRGMLVDPAVSSVVVELDSFLAGLDEAP